MLQELPKKYEKNVGPADRAIRIAAGSAMLVAYAMLPDAEMRGLLLIGIVPLVTGLVGMCGLYRLMGMNTCDWPKR